MKHYVIGFVLLICIESVVYSNTCFFHLDDSAAAISSYSNQTENLYLTFELPDDWQDYDAVELKFFGTDNKRAKHQRHYLTHVLSIDFIKTKQKNTAVFELKALEKKDDNVWFSEIGLEKFLFLKFHMIRVELHLLKANENIVSVNSSSNHITAQYIEHAVASSGWLTVSKLSKKLNPQRGQKILPAVALGFVGGISLLAIATQ
ncbi:MAG: hypothetical protein IPM74_15545 [Crocinitomicaceae bacterium]|nr:hypothetical protein [Crocinitomicaceae bacterium]